MIINFGKAFCEKKISLPEGTPTESDCRILPDLVGNGRIWSDSVGIGRNWSDSVVIGRNWSELVGFGRIVITGKSGRNQSQLSELVGIGRNLSYLVGFGHNRRNRSDLVGFGRIWSEWSDLVGFGWIWSDLFGFGRSSFWEGTLLSLVYLPLFINDISPAVDSCFRLILDIDCTRANKEKAVSC